jgi:hypothetical protein
LPGPFQPKKGRTLGKFRIFDLVTSELAATDVEYGDDFSTAAFSNDGRSLALGYEDGRLLLWKPPPLPARKPLPDTIAPAKLKDLWQSLAGADAKAAYDARWLLSAAPKQTLPLLRAELQREQIDPKKIPAWIAQLDNNAFKERDAAMRELEKAADAAEPLLKKVLTQNPTLELKQRVELLLAKLAAPPTGDRLRTLRSIVILEAIATDEAQAILRTLADGDPGSRITEAAQAALKRVEVAKSAKK